MSIMHFALEVLGPYASLTIGLSFALDHGLWLCHVLPVRVGLIDTGTGETQGNILGERVLWLPKG